MSFGLTPNFATDVPLDGLTPKPYLALCFNTANTLDWDIRYVSDSGLIAFTTKKMFKRKQEVTIRIYEDHANIHSESLGRQMLDGGRNRDNVLAFTDLLAENKASATPEQLEQTYQGLKDRFPAPDQDILSKPPEATKGRWAAFFSLFVPRKDYFVTPILVDLNIAIFLLMVLTGANIVLPDSHSLVTWGANSRSLTLNHQWWRIITCNFVHFGIIHLLLNMYALLYIGMVLEPQLGRLRFATAYLLTGVMASLASLYWHASGLSVGASGAIFGMYGLFLALLTTNLIHKIWRGALLASIGIFVGYNLLVGMTSDFIGNSAHVAGLVSGILIGYLFYPGLKKPDNPRLLYPPIALAALVVLSTSIVAFKKIPNYYGLYYQQMLTYGKYEKRALAIYELNSDTPKEIWLAAIRDSGIYNWNQAILVLERTNELELPDLLKRRNDILIQYCNLRIASYNYFASKIAGTTGPGEDSVPIYNVQITELLNNLKTAK